MQNWIRKERIQASPVLEEFAADNGVVLLKFPLFSDLPSIIHGFSTRIGGVSEGPCASLNLSFTRKSDRKENVLENYRRVSEALGVELDSFTAAYQTHTTNIRRVDERDRGKGIVRERDYTDIDGLITDQKGITLVTYFADCIPLYFVDPLHQAIGLAHSGWRGTVDGMAVEMVKAMQENFGSKAQDLRVCIGPGICLDCYEISLDVAERFQKRFGERSCEILGSFYGEHCHLDLWKANELLLLEAGVLSQHICVADICTHCNPDLLFSHRHQGEDRGNLAAFLALT